MYKYLITPIFCLWMVSCTKTERGAIDPDTIAKKMFDAVRNNAEAKSEELLPDKGTFRKIAAEQGREPANLEKAYEQFLSSAAAAFETAHSKTATWDGATFTRANYTESKLDKLPVARITTKFLVNNVPQKFECSAVKFNNRWYYYGDILWIDKPE